MACGCATLKPAQFPSGHVRCVTGGSAARWRRTVGHSVYSKSSPSLPHGRIRHVRTKLANKKKEEKTLTLRLVTEGSLIYRTAF